MKINTHIKVVAGFTLAVTVVAVACVLSYGSLKKLTGALDNLTDENERLTLVKRLNSISQKPDEFIKEYALSKQHQSIDSLNKYLALQHISLEELRQLCFESLEQLSIVDSLTSYLKAKEDWYYQLVNLKSNHKELEMYNTLSKKIAMLSSNLTDDKEIRNPASKKGLFFRIFGFGEKAETFNAAGEVQLPRSSVEKMLSSTQHEISLKTKGEELSELALLEQLRSVKEKIDRAISNFENNESIAAKNNAYRSVKVAENSIIQIAVICVSGILTFIFFLLYISADVSRNNKLRMELARSKREALKLLISKSKFLSSVSHEIRTPLNSIIGFSEQLRSARDETEKERFREAIHHSSEHLLNLVNDVLDYSKLEMEKVHFEKIPFKLNDVVMDVMEMLSSDAFKKSILFSYVPLKSDPELIGDPNRLKQILTNLISNAVKFTDKGKVDVKVECNAIDDKNMQVQFYIKDTGIGINPENLKNIFLSFNQGDQSIPRKFGGTGLGLAICKNLVELQGGEIEAWSKPGEGTIFSFYLDYPVSKEMTLVDIKKASFDTGALMNYNILIADDDDMSALLLSSIMYKYKIPHDIAMNGQLAWDKFNEKNYDLVITDINMPEINGIDLLKMIRSHPDKQKRALKVVAMTAHISKSEIESFLKMGFSGCILKPYKEDALINTVCQALGIQDRAKPIAEKKEIKVVKGKELTYSFNELNKLANNNTEFVIKMIETFIKGSSEISTQMRESLNKKDWTKLSGLAHKAIPSFSFMGLHPYIEKLKFIENNANNYREQNKVKDLVSFIEKNINIILNDMQKEIHKLKKTSLN